MFYAKSRLFLPKMMVLFVHKVSTNFVNIWLSVLYKYYQNMLKIRIFEANQALGENIAIISVKNDNILLQNR